MRWSAAGAGHCCEDNDSNEDAGENEENADAVQFRHKCVAEADGQCT